MACPRVLSQRMILGPSQYTIFGPPPSIRKQEITRFFIILGLGLVKTISDRALRLGHARGRMPWVGQAKGPGLRPHDQLIPSGKNMRCMFKMDRRGWGVQNTFYLFILYYFRVRLGQFLSRVPWVGRVWGRSATAMTELQFQQFSTKLIFKKSQVRLRNFLDRVLRLGQARGPSAAARTGQGAGRCGHMTNLILVFNIRCMYKIHSLENYQDAIK